MYYAGAMLTRATLEGLCRWTDLHSEMLSNISHREQEANKELIGMIYLKLSLLTISTYRNKEQTRQNTERKE